jgi:hypothetical protein
MTGSAEAPRSRRRLGRILVRGGATCLIVGPLLYVLYVLAGPNYHTVVPGLVYRSAQLSPASLAVLVRHKDIHTVINLRGCCDPLPWYGEESALTNQLNISQEDISFSAGRLPSVPALRQLIEVLDRSTYPVLLHCNKGSDRTGLASTIAVLLKTDQSLQQACGQLSWRYGHLPLGRTTNIDRFFTLYQEWLEARGQSHTPQRFRQWATSEYCPGECRCRIEVLEPLGEPIHVPALQPTAIRVRCWNTSIKPWRLHPGNNTGIHLGMWIFDDQRREVGAGRTGLYHAVVPPGQYIDLTMVTPALLPGTYDLRADMMDEQQAVFNQTGSEPLFCKVEVP